MKQYLTALVLCMLVAATAAPAQAQTINDGVQKGKQVIEGLFGKKKKKKKNTPPPAEEPAEPAYEEPDYNEAEMRRQQAEAMKQLQGMFGNGEPLPREEAYHFNTRVETFMEKD